MRKTLILLIFMTLKAGPAKGDAIFFPMQFAGICYSAELVTNLEIIKKPKATTAIWAGMGVVGTFLERETPVYGLEAAIERRHYFVPETFRNFFISGYVGTALMTDFREYYYLGLIPGFKINYKVHLSEKIILEPYVGLSVPVVYDMRDAFLYVPFPALTVGMRFGLLKLRKGL
jgi:hypothetical protein